MQREGMSVNGRIGTWYVIDEFQNSKGKYFLLESEKYGDEAAALVVDANGAEVCETFDGIETALRDKGLF
jgi:hypothetical protein